MSITNRMTNRLLLFLSFFCISHALLSQIYRTSSIVDDVHSVEVQANGKWDSYPIINYNSDDRIHIDFDLVSDESPARLRYKIIFCNTDWSKNNAVSEIEYLDGFDDNPIDDYSNSINTTVSFTHYSLQIPNSEVKPKLAGNYTVLVYDEAEGEDETLLMACFSVLDSKVSIAPEISSTTDIDANNEHHQLSFDLNYNLPLRDVRNDLKVLVRQNNRIDNERKDVKPNYIMPSKLRYIHNKDLIFEAGNEYNRFDVSSYKFNGRNVAHIEYKRPNYHMYIVPTRINKDGTYSYDQDQNGRVIYKNFDSENAKTEGDYFFVQLSLHADRALASDIYINGAFSNNTFSEKYKMKYDNENNEYSLTLFLKQGIYNYQYLTKTANAYSTKEIGGNFYETENEYSIYVYYRPIGQKYDSLVGFTSLQSRQK